MRILYIYRHPDMGFSIGKVFKPIEEDMKKYAEVDSVYLPCSNYKPKSLWKNIRAARKAVSRKGYDIIHITGAEHYLIPFLNRYRTVVTVHDLGFYTNHKKSLRTIWKYLTFVKTLEMADYTTYISQKSMDEADKYINIRNDKKIVINNPVGKEYSYHPKDININNPTILHVGTKPNKNLDRTIKALNGINCHLRIIGNLSEEQQKLLDENRICHSCVYNITDDEILEEYVNADIISFPSLYEGFGMPIIEGQSIGRPVLTSNLSPMNEIAGTGAVLVDPTDVNDIRNGFLTLLNNVEKICRDAVENSRRFQVDIITKQFFEVYQRIINQ